LAGQISPAAADHMPFPACHRVVTFDQTPPLAAAAAGGVVARFAHMANSALLLVWSRTVMPGQTPPLAAAAAAAARTACSALPAAHQDFEALDQTPSLAAAAAAVAAVVVRMVPDLVLCACHQLVVPDQTPPLAAAAAAAELAGEQAAAAGVVRRALLLWI
jgi:hypothetical protein